MDEIFTIGRDEDQEISGVICTLDWQYDDPATERGRAHLRMLAHLREDGEATVAFPFPYDLKHAILHVYLSMAAHIGVRLAFSHAEPGEPRPVFRGRIITPRCWLVCSGPVSQPPMVLDRRELGRRRYTAALW